MNSNKRQAVALDYNKDKKQGAPRIVAIGEGYIAEKIIDKAREYEVPIVEDVETVSKLVKMPIGSEIPEELYGAVAKILAFLYDMENNSKKKKAP